MLVYVTWKNLIVFLRLICFIIQTVFQAIFSNTTAKKESRNQIKDKGAVQGQQLTFKNYIDLTTNIFNKNRGISISDIRDMEAIFNSAYQNKDKYQLVYSSYVSVNDAINKICSLDCVKVVVEHIRKVFLDDDFDLEDRFCNAQELRESLSSTKISDVLLTFFISLFKLMEPYV